MDSQGPKARLTFLDLINAVSNVPQDFDYGGLFRLLLPRDTRAHGFVLPSVVARMPWAKGFTVDAASRSVRLRDGSGGGSTGWACGEAFAKTGYVAPMVLYVYDAEVSEDMKLEPGHDGEVAAFYLWTVAQVRDALEAGQFKPNCALVMIDFFVRHGILTPDTEADYIEIVTRLRMQLPVPVSPTSGA